MAEVLKNQGNTKKARAKPRRKPRGRKSAATAAKTKRKTPGKGAARLRSAINSLLDEESGRIAKALVDKTIAGNMTGARIVVALADTKLPPKEQKKKRHGPKLIDLLESEPEWEEPPDSNAGVPFGPLEPIP